MLCTICKYTYLPVLDEMPSDEVGSKDGGELEHDASSTPSSPYVPSTPGPSVPSTSSISSTPGMENDNTYVLAICHEYFYLYRV